MENHDTIDQSIITIPTTNRQYKHKRKHKSIQSKKKHRKRVVTNKKRGGGRDYWKNLFLYLKNLINCTIVKSDVNNTQEIMNNFTQQLSGIKKPTKEQLKQLDPLLKLIKLFKPILDHTLRLMDK